MPNARRSAGHTIRNALLLLSALVCANARADGDNALPVDATKTPALSTHASPVNARGSGAIAIPNPPTNLRIEVLPATEIVDRVFQRSGVPKEARSLLVDVMKNLSSEDLTYLAKGSDPSGIGLAPPASVAAEDWKNFVQAYAEATMADRKGRSDFVSQLTVGVLLAVFSLPLTLLAGMWLERRKTKAAVAPQAQPEPEGNARISAKRQREGAKR